MMNNFDLRRKKVIDMDTAEVIGYIREMDIDLASGMINSVTVPRKGWFRITKDMTVPWASVVAIGSEFVLVKTPE